MSKEKKLISSSEQLSSVLPSSILAGPIVRHCDTTQLNFWLVTTSACDVIVKIYRNEEGSKHPHTLLSETKLAASSSIVNSDNRIKNKSSELQQIQIGTSAYINLVKIYAQSSDDSFTNGDLFPENVLLTYDIIVVSDTSNESIATLPHLLYSEQNLPSLVIKPTIDKLLHGSCRKPHFDSEDGLKQVDNLLNTSGFNLVERPSMLIMSGDQIYADDVAGPTLYAIHQVIEILGLFDETWDSDNNKVNNSQALFKHEHCYYQREDILPNQITRSFLGDKLSPIFTSVHVSNHLITLSEVMAMYLLTWSPELWNQVNIETLPSNVPDTYHATYLKELEVIKNFHQGLYKVRRAMAHIPVYMIFDDHDITDDWNLTRGWEEAAYNNLFSKNIIGNALIGYFLCQGWGNAPEKFNMLLSEQKKYFSPSGSINKGELIDKLFRFEQWNYNLNTLPKIVVLDTRTQRWRSESNANKPSGLMDWETLSEFQQELIKEPSVIVVSPAPIYGVKLIETIQRIFTLCGKPLAVDAENWMAHSGTANVILNIFRNPKTPPNFIILSGDVHYSFVYEVTHRFRKNSAKITQVTCSGIKNTFPNGLLITLEKLNKVLYSTYSPLNWFTKRRRMKIRARKLNTEAEKHLFNSSGIGVLKLSKDSDDVITEVITSKGETVEFESHDFEDE